MLGGIVPYPEIVAHWEDEQNGRQPGNQSISAKINDRLFIQQLGYTRSLVIFLIRRQALPGKLTDVFGNLAALGALRYSRAGRAVTEEEWRKLYSISHDLTSELP